MSAVRFRLRLRRVCSHQGPAPEMQNRLKHGLAKAMGARDSILGLIGFQGLGFRVLGFRVSDLGSHLHGLGASAPGI